MSNGITNVHIDNGPDKDSGSARSNRASVVGAMATKTVLYQTDPAFKIAVDDLVQGGVALSAAESQVIQLAAELAMARGTRDAKRNAYDKAYGVCAASVEHHSTTPEDVQSYGFVVRSKSAQSLDPPSDIMLKYDVAKGLIRARVVYASGKSRRCALEISPDPIGSAPFVRLEGTGVRRALHGYAPGTWWLRAATLGAKAQSDWFGPVAVVVK